MKTLNSKELIAYATAFVSFVLPKIETDEIILFGSVARKEATEKSDIDLAVETLDNKGLRIQELGVLPRLGYRKGVKVILHIFSRNQVDLNLFSNIANGIVLEGFLEVRP